MEIFLRYKPKSGKVTTIEYNRTALREFLDLGDQHLTVFATIAGNDVIHIDEVKHCHRIKIGNSLPLSDEHFYSMKFNNIAIRVRLFDEWDHPCLISHLAQFLLHDASAKSELRILESIDQYNVVSFHEIVEQ